MSDTQVFVALAVALIPGLLALRLSTELYKQLVRLSQLAPIGRQLTHLTFSMLIWEVAIRLLPSFSELVNVADRQMFVTTIDQTGRIIDKISVWGH